MTEDEYVRHVANLAGVRLPNPDAEKRIRFYHQLSAPVWQGVEWIKESPLIERAPFSARHNGGDSR